MPKISDEFKPSPPAPQVSAAVQAAAQPAKPEAKAPQPVVRPAPMAPRTPVAKPAAKAPTPATAIATAAKRVPEPMTLPPQDALAEKLKAQRAAAEKLAEQRVNAARQRAEKRNGAVEPSFMAKPSTGDGKGQPQPPPRPKFSFADDDAGRREPGAAAESLASSAPPRPAPATTARQPLLPPRPALGGDRTQPSLLRGSQTPSFRADAAPPPFRPIDPATGYPGLAARSAAYTGQRAFGPDTPQGFATRLPARPAGFEPYRRGEAPATTAFEPTDPYGDGSRPSRTAPARVRSRPAEEHPDDIFEDEAPPQPTRRRAVAGDYQSAYREAEAGFEDDRRRSSGPWLLMIALLVAGAVVVAGLWIYNNKIRNVAGGQATDTVPVVAAPEQPAKTATVAPTEGVAEAPTTGSKKQIYDRIVGDQEVSGGKVVPTEVTPIQPETGQQGAGQAMQPAGSTGQTGQGSEVPIPLPLPPPPGDTTSGSNTQGKIDQPLGNNIAAIAPSAVPQLKTGDGDTASGSGMAAATATTTNGGAADTAQASPLSVTEPAAKPTATATTPSDGSTAAASTAASDGTTADSSTTPSVESVGGETPPAPLPKKAAATHKTVSQKKTAQQETASLGASPVVLVPPGQQTGSQQATSPSQGTFETSTQPVQQVQQVQPPPPRKKKTLLDLLGGSNASSSQGAAEQVAVEPMPQNQSAGTKVAAVPQTQVQTPTPAPPTASGTYMVQLSAFQSQAEAQTEYGRLRSQYPAIVGTLPPQITAVAVFGSTRYRLGLGPVKTRDQATQLCSSLFGVGVRDCLVRKQ
ncbi:MAG: SPOR domain-containing protein [Rhizobiales bacterium]|nr:SPOR domain-containing protein [Hyphomicrobiales bacterium]